MAKRRYDKSEILARLEKEILFLDGAMGTQLQLRGMTAGRNPEAYNLYAPDMMREIHTAYVTAGADFLIANTFGALPDRLKEYGLDDKLEHIVQSALCHCRSAAEQADHPIYALANAGPTGRFMTPIGDAEFDWVFDQYARLMTACEAAGFDGIIIETISDIREMKAILMAANEHFSGLKIALMTFQDVDGTVTGTRPEAFLKVAERLGADIIGLNCTTGPEEFFPIVDVLRKQTDRPIAVEPNAGLPRLINGENVYPDTPDDLADAAVRFAESGVNIIGGCCGTSPEFIRRMKAAVGDRKPAPRPTLPEDVTWLTTRFDAFAFTPDTPCVIIGERINPTGRKKFKRSLRAGDFKIVRQEAISQTAAGAQILDVNMGVGNFDETGAMRRAVHLVQDNTNLPICVDSSSLQACEMGLKEYAGKALLNSISAEEEKLRDFAPLAAKYGAAVVALALDDDGIPPDRNARIRCIEKILERTDSLGIPRCDILADCLSLPVAAKPDQITETLDAIRQVKALFGVKTVLGVSNVSFGLPNRPLINRAFLTMAIQAGLDFAIVNPLDADMLNALYAASTLAARDQNNARYVTHITTPDSKNASDPDGMTNLTPIDALRHAIVTGDKENVLSFVENALNNGAAPLAISEHCLLPALDVVGKKFAKKEYFLPQVLLSAEASKIVFDRIRNELKVGEGEQAGSIVLATVKGDVHDIGKNIVAAIMENNGWTVYDLGKNVASDAIVDEAIRQRVDIIGLSALMTTTMERMRDVVSLAKERGFPGKIIVGGAVITQDYANKIGADAYAPDAMTGLTLAKTLAGIT